MKGSNSGYFQSQGVGSKHKQPVISCIYPIKVDAILRTIENRSAYIRKAVIKQMYQDGLLDEQLVEELRANGLLD
jgi:hypothetical protein